MQSNKDAENVFQELNKSLQRLYRAVIGTYAAILILCGIGWLLIYKFYIKPRSVKKGKVWATKGTEPNYYKIVGPPATMPQQNLQLYPTLPGHVVNSYDAGVPTNQCYGGGFSGPLRTIQPEDKPPSYQYTVNQPRY